MQSDEFLSITADKEVVVVSDPPFNIGYKYTEYNDNMPQAEYIQMLADICKFPAVIIHYPEALYELAIYMRKAPEKVVAWVYNTQLAKQHRDIAFWDVKPDFSQVLQPYKNPNDKRIKARIEGGGAGLQVI